MIYMLEPPFLQMVMEAIEVNEFMVCKCESGKRSESAWTSQTHPYLTAVQAKEGSERSLHKAISGEEENQELAMSVPLKENISGREPQSQVPEVPRRASGGEDQKRPLVQTQEGTGDLV